MKKSLCASTAALALVLASAMLAPACAADLSIAPIYKAPPAAASWAGSYVGIAGGGAWGSALLRNNTTAADQAPRLNLSGGIIGLTSGFNLQNGNWLLGFEGDISAANKKASAFEFPPNAAWTAGGGVEVKLSQDWSAKVEYLYVGLQDKSYFTPTPSPAFPGNQRLHVDDHIVRVGVNYKLPWNILDSFFKH